jgi:hypothetical protein
LLLLQGLTRSLFEARQQLAEREVELAKCLTTTVPLFVLWMLVALSVWDLFTWGGRMAWKRKWPEGQFFVDA